MEIALIVNGGREMGMGHIVRGITLAEELRDKAEIFFVTNSDDIVVSQIQKAGYNAYSLDTDYEKVSLLRRIKPDAVVIDRLEVPVVLARGLKDCLNTRLVFFDNISEANKYADVVVNFVMGSDNKNRAYLDKETNTFYFYGLRYEILRKEFYEHRKSPNPSHEVERILLIFGGSDPLNLTTAVLDELLSLVRYYDIDVVTGVYFEYSKELNKVLARHTEKRMRVRIYRDADNITELMYQSDLVVSSPGLSVFEAMCVRVPVIPIHQNEPQRCSFQKFMPTLDKNEIWRLCDIISKGEYADPFGEYIRSFEVGEGKDEVIKAILGEITK